jgi:predicted nucleotidyltransferase
MGWKVMATKFEIAQDFAREIKSDRIKLMILFGSVARGDYRPDSDIDILVVSDYHSEIWPEISEIIASTVFEKEELLSVHVMPEKIFNETKEHSFLTNVLKEGIILEGN